MEQNTSVANFFKNAFNIDWKDMEIGNPVDVSNYGKYVKSFNSENQKNEFHLVTKIVRKPDSPEYKVTIGSNTFSCSGDHKIACKFRQDKDDFTYQPISVLIGKKVFGFIDEIDWKPVQIEKTGNMIPILDFEVDKVHNYYSDKILSHNTMYGNPETTSGGRALKFFTSIRLDVRRIEYINEGDKIIGLRTRVKGTKNKTAPPFRKAEIEIIFGKGIQYEAEYRDFAVHYGIIDKAASYFTIKDREGNEIEKMQGKDKVTDYLKNNPEIFDDIKARVKEAMNPSETDNLQENAEK
jgi:hypothetical protein